MRTAATIAWTVAGVSVLLLLLSFTGPGVGYGGMAMGWMWLWMVLPVVVLAAVLINAYRLPAPPEIYKPNEPRP